MIRFILAAILWFFFVPILLAQVPRKILVEHFTNTNCSTCANRNPAFYTNLDAQGSDVLHLAIHPSSPYPSCLLSQQNMPDNDQRTNYYGIYGATPRLVIGGNVIPSSNDYGNAALFAPYLNQFSPASIRIEQRKFGNDSIQATIVVKTMAQHALGNLRLFAALSENLVFYTGNNNESQHRDVFRASLFGAEGISFALPQNVGDSLVFTRTLLANPIWDFSRIYILAMAQEEATQSIVQAETVSPDFQSPVTVNITHVIPHNELSISISDSQLLVEMPNETPFDLLIYTTNGQIVFTTCCMQNRCLINLSSLPKGIYMAKIRTKQQLLCKKIVLGF